MASVARSHAHRRATRSGGIADHDLDVLAPALAARGFLVIGSEQAASPTNADAEVVIVTGQDDNICPASLNVAPMVATLQERGIDATTTGGAVRSCAVAWPESGDSRPGVGLVSR